MRRSLHQTRWRRSSGFFCGIRSAKSLDKTAGTIYSQKLSETTYLNKMTKDRAATALQRAAFAGLMLIAGLAHGQSADLREQARCGDAQAQFSLGMMHEQGVGAQYNEFEAVRWYRLAADQGLPAAQAALASMHSTGMGTKRSAQQALEWYCRAATQGHALAQFTLGAKYEQGLEVDRDDREAARWFRLAADQGHAKAQIHLGWMYASGRGVDLDTAQATRWLRLAAAQDDAGAHLAAD